MCLYFTDWTFKQLRAGLCFIHGEIFPENGLKVDTQKTQNICSKEMM